MDQCFQLFVFTVAAFWGIAAGVRIQAFVIPKVALSGQRVLIECSYDLGFEELYSFKMYKGQIEFYRYSPNANPPVQIFPVSGITVNKQNSTDHSVQLESVQLTTSGVYQCEVSTEAPTFSFAEAKQEMIVIDLPDDPPVITGGRNVYKTGERGNLKCTSKRSSPKAELQWYINGNKVPSNFVKEYPTIDEGGGFHSSSLGLDFTIKGHHFVRGKMTLRCEASIGDFYREKSVLVAKLRGSSRSHCFLKRK